MKCNEMLLQNQTKNFKKLTLKENFRKEKM